MEVLYKYVTHRRALTCIPEVGDGTLRATQPAALDDPFECAVTTDYLIPNEWEENRQLADTLTQINKSKPVTATDVDRARRKYGSLFTRQLLAEQVSTRFGIVSFATDPLHPLLWSHYTSDGSGFVIGYDHAELCKIARLGRLPATRCLPGPANPDRRADCLSLATVEPADPPVLQEQPLVLRG